MPSRVLTIELIDAFGVGVYFLFVLVHGNLWLHRRDRPSHLWLACASAGALLVDLTGMSIRASGDAAPVWQAALNQTGVALATASLFQLVASLGERPAGRLARVLLILVLVSAPGPALLAWTGLTQAHLLACMLLLVAALVRAFSAGRAGDAESRTIARGLFLLLATLIADVLMELKVLPMLPGLPVVGFTLLFLASALALNARFDREHQELVALRGELEDRVKERTQALEDANQRLAEASRTDLLTGLPNRRGFLEAAGMELARISKAWRPCTLVMADVDHLRKINDTLGHATGDAVLQGMAVALKQALRGQDLVAWWGGGEFILLLPETDGPGAVRTIESARRVLMAQDLGREGERIPVTASFGIMEHQPGSTLEATLAEADRALSRAKVKGRNHVEVGPVPDERGTPAPRPPPKR